MERTLILLRHAKSDWPDGVPDHDRPLAKRGRRDAPQVGRWLREHGYLPDTVICSTALRTRQTWDLVAEKLVKTAGTGAPEVTFEQRAYGASAATLLYLVAELPADRRSVLLIGHNPGISELASALTGKVTGFPTAGLAVLELSAPDGVGLAPGGARLVTFVRPADM